MYNSMICILDRGHQAWSTDFIRFLSWNSHICGLWPVKFERRACQQFGLESVRWEIACSPALKAHQYVLRMIVWKRNYHLNFSTCNSPVFGEELTNGMQDESTKFHDMGGIKCSVSVSLSAPLWQPPRHVEDGSCFCQNLTRKWIPCVQIKIKLIIYSYFIRCQGFDFKNLKDVKVHAAWPFGCSIHLSSALDSNLMTSGPPCQNGVH